MPEDHQGLETMNIITLRAGLKITPKVKVKKKSHRLTSESVCVPDNIWAHA